MKKTAFLVLILLITFIPFVGKKTVAAEESLQSDVKFEDILDELLKSTDTSGLEELYNEYALSICSDKSFGDFLKDISGGNTALDYGNFFECFANVFLKDLLGFFSIFACVVAAMTLNGLLGGISASKRATGDVAFAVCYLSVAFFVFGETAKIATEIISFIKNVTKISERIYPVLLTLVAASGGVSKANALKPVCVIVTQGVSNATVNVLLPLVTVICVLGAVSSLSERFSLKKTKDFFQGAFKWISGISVAVFSAFTAVSGMGAASHDGVSLRALKYAIGNAVPGVGGFAKEGIDVALAASAVLKNSLGSVFSIALVCAFVVPLLKAIALSLGFKMLAAIGEPLADKRITDMISSFSGTVGMFAVILVVVFTVFFFSVYVLVFAGGTLF